jgi:hypothetical protein
MTLTKQNFSEILRNFTEISFPEEIEKIKFRGTDIRTVRTGPPEKASGMEEPRTRQREQLVRSVITVYIRNTVSRELNKIG